MSDTQQTQISTLPKLALAAVLAFGVASCGTGSFTEQISKVSKYNRVLDECKELNVNFSKKVFDYLNL